MLEPSPVINCVAFDCSNSSIRAVLGRCENERIHMEVIHEVPNQPIDVGGLYYWDILYIFNEMQKGLTKAYHVCGDINSAGICTWGVDFGLLGATNLLLANPMSYRNTIGLEILETLSSEELRQNFYQTGIQNDRINSLYQLLAIRKLFPELFSLAKDVLMIPDLLLNMFTGIKRTEPTIASTTQIMNVQNRSFSEEVMSRYGLDARMFPGVAYHGHVLGYIKQGLAETLKINELPFVCVASHDTASAVAAVPASARDLLFVSSGTWSLIGTELAAPIIDDNVYKLGFTNELGAYGTVTLLKNSTGLHIIQSVRRELAREGRQYSWDEIVDIAQTHKGPTPLIDPNDPAFFNPPSMIAAIKDYCGQTGQETDLKLPAMIMAIYQSLAYSYRLAFSDIERITGKTYDTVHIIGGGSRNRFLNQLVADITGKTVLAGPAEATSMGNLAIQCGYHRQTLGLEYVRDLVRNSFAVEKFVPNKHEAAEDRLPLFIQLAKMNK